jgi:LTXXQ motif family protein
MVGIILGAIGGFAAVNAFARIRRRRMMMRFGGEVWQVAGDVRRAAGDLRFGKWRGLAAAAEALGDDAFDRARVEAAADQQLANLTTLRKAVIDGLARVHAILTPEQRSRVREMFAQREYGGAR